MLSAKCCAESDFVIVFFVGCVTQTLVAILVNIWIPDGILLGDRIHTHNQPNNQAVMLTTANVDIGRDWRENFDENWQFW